MKAASGKTNNGDLLKGFLALLRLLGFSTDPSGPPYNRFGQKNSTMIFHRQLFKLLFNTTYVSGWILFAADRNSASFYRPVLYLSFIMKNP